MRRNEAAGLPWSDLPLSFRVDLLQLLSATRPAIRSHIDVPQHEQVQEWCAASELDFAAEGPWVSMSTEFGRAAQILRVDGSPGPHEISLGLLLGYPMCCCQGAARVGEAQIDEYADHVSAWSLSDRYALLDISRYDEGLALISHVPCSPNCEPSRILAQQSVTWLSEQPCTSEPYPSWRLAASSLASSTVIVTAPAESRSV